MKVFLILIVLLPTSLTTGYPLASTSRAKKVNQVARTCEEATTEIARFKHEFSEWGSGKGGDSWRSSKYSSAEGESFSEGFNFYKSKSRFKKNVRQINEEVGGATVRTLLLDDTGRQVGQRVVKETRVAGKVSSVLIRRITDRTIQGISAPSLKLALTVEKAHITCRVKAERNPN
jgi:hypothetical protein